MDARRLAEHLVGAAVALLVHFRASHAGHHDDVALAVQLAHQELRPGPAHFILAGVHLQATLRRHSVVEGDHQDAARCALIDDAVQPRRRCGVDDDGVGLLGDEVGKLLRLLADVVVGVEDAALDLGLERLHSQGGLEDVLHLQAPLVADEGVGQGNLEPLALRQGGAAQSSNGCRGGHGSEAAPCERVIERLHPFLPCPAVPA